MASSRRRVSVAENRVGIGILLVLTVVGVVLGLQQFRYDPQRFRLGIAPRASVVETGFVLPPGAVAVSPSERFDAATLSDKIDGRAELYLGAGFKSLECRRFGTAHGDPDVVEGCVYDLGSAENAYAVWSQQRRQGAPEAGIGPHSYLTSSGIFLCSGKFYLEVLSTRGGEGAMALARVFALQVASAGGTGTGLPMQASLLPAEGRVAGSETMLKTSAVGFDRLDRVSMARYRFGPVEATGFVTSRTDSSEALMLSNAWRDTLMAQGCGRLDPPAGIPGAWALDAAGMIEVGFARGAVFAGVHEAESREVADALAASLWTSIQGGKP